MVVKEHNGSFFFNMPIEKRAANSCAHLLMALSAQDRTLSQSAAKLSYSKEQSSILFIKASNIESRKLKISKTL